MRNLTGIILASSLLIGCGTVQSVALPLPVRPVWTIIPTEETQCLTDSAFEKLWRRDIEKDNHIDKLESIIKATH